MRTLLLLMPIALLLSCDFEDSKNIEEGDIIVVLDTCGCADLSEEDRKFKLEGEYYSGICVERYQGTSIPFLASMFKDGEKKLNRYYDREGNMTHEEAVSNATKTGRANECECSELKEKEVTGMTNTFKEYYLGENRFTGICYSYFKDSKQMAVKKKFRKGLLHGTVEVFSKSGETVSIQYYEDGTYIGEEFPQ